MNPAIFREYDIRGIADQDYDVDFARVLGRAYATYVADKNVKRVTVGRDARLTSNKYADALKDGLRSGGLDVVDLGMTPTPLVYYSLYHLEVDNDVVIRIAKTAVARSMSDPDPAAQPASRTRRGLLGSGAVSKDADAAAEGDESPGGDDDK